MQKQNLSNTTNKTTIIQWVLLILAFILSIVGIIIGLSSNSSKDSSGGSDVCPTDELLDLSNTVSSLKDTVSSLEDKCIFYDDELNIQSKTVQNGGGGYLSDREDDRGNAAFQPGSPGDWEKMYIRKISS